MSVIWIFRSHKGTNIRLGWKTSKKTSYKHLSPWQAALAEIQLTHDVGSAVTRAYRRTDMIEKRHHMMVEWGNFFGCLLALQD